MATYDEHVQSGTPVTQLVNRKINPLVNNFTLFVGGFGGAGTTQENVVDQGDELLVTSWQTGDDGKSIWLTAYLTGDNSNTLYTFPINAAHKFDYTPAEQSQIQTENQGINYHPQIPDIWGWIKNNLKLLGWSAAAIALFIIALKSKRK